MIELRWSDRTLWSVLALGGASLAVASIVLTEWLDLHPCHLCIFQRLLFMLLTVACALAAWRPRGFVGRGCGVAVIGVSALGVGVAAYQSRLQWEAAKNPMLSCGGGDPNAIERFVDYLGAHVPSLFFATGFCEDTELVIFGLSLANWALVSFSGFLALGGWLTVRAFRGLR